MRRKYSGLDSFLVSDGLFWWGNLRRIQLNVNLEQSHVAADMARDVPPELAHELSVVYFPQLGYLATVPHRDGDVDVASFAEIGWTYQVRVGFCSRSLANANAAYSAPSLSTIVKSS
jgi:hypothetical protein